MQAPPTEETGAGGVGGTGIGGSGDGAGDGGASTTGGGGIAGAAVSFGGSGGTGGSASTIANGGTTGIGGATGTGGATATGGATGAGGAKATGGTIGTGGATGAGGATGTGGGNGTGGATGAGGTAGAGGLAGAAGKTGGTGGTTGVGGSGAATGTGGVAGAGGAAGAGGKGGAGGNVCPLGGALDCSSTGALKLPDGHVADFSVAEWNGSTATWCDADGLRGTVFSYSGPSPSAATAIVDTTTQSLKLNLTVGATGYAGGGLTFDSCVNASSFTSIQFTAAITSGTLTGCTWQAQLQTQDQRPSTDTNPSGGTCSSSCYRYPAATGLTFPTTTASTYREAFALFNNPAGSAISTPTQVTGVQWQVNSGSSGAGTCTVELRIDNIAFR